MTLQHRFKPAVSLYDLDGINLWDKGAGYGKEGMAPINDTSYAKLIKALKNAMPDKLLTLVDTRETTEALCDEQAGISVGNYLDYAWSSLEDFLAPYETDATIRPLAGISEKKYGTIFLQGYSRYVSRGTDEFDGKYHNRRIYEHDAVYST